jgi:hypothetical protein
MTTEPRGPQDAEERFGLQVLTPGMYWRVSRVERRLSRRFFASYMASPTDWDAAQRKDEYWKAIKFSYGNSNRVLLSAAAFAGIVGGSLISVSSGEAAIWMPGAAILGGVAVQLIRCQMRAIQIDRYLITGYHSDPLGSLTAEDEGS